MQSKMSVAKLVFMLCISIALIGSTSVYALEAKALSSAEINVIASGASDSKVTKITVNNPSGTDSEIYGLDIYVPSGIKIQTALVPEGWTVKIKSDVVSFDTKDKPISGTGEIFSITTDVVLTSLYYEAYDPDNNLLASQFLPVALVSYTQPPYTNDLYGFSIKYPQGWFLKENPELQGFTAVVGFLGPSTDDFNTNINIKTSDLQGASFAEYVDSAKNALASVFDRYDYILTDEGKAQIGGNPAYFLEYTANMGTQVSFKTVIVDYGNTIYLVTLASSHSQYDKMVKSFDSSIVTLHISKDIHKDSPKAHSGTKM